MRHSMRSRPLFLCGNVEPAITAESVANQIGRTDADLAVFIDASTVDFCAGEALNLGKTFAEHGFLWDAPAKMIVPERRTCRAMWHTII
jgi:hypothetical protein